MQLPLSMAMFSEMRKLTGRFEVSPVKTGLVFQRIGNNFLDGYGHWMRGYRQVIRVNQLSETKVYPHPNVNKSTTALFPIFGIYGWVRKNAETTS